jgi:hypothetical protein
MRRRLLFPYTFFYHCCGCILWEELCGRRRRVSSSRFFFFHVAGDGCVGVDAQLLLVSSTSSVGRMLFRGCYCLRRSVSTISLDVGKADQRVSDVINFRLG